MVRNMDAILEQALSAALSDIAFLDLAQGEPETGVDESLPFVWAEIDFVRPLEGRMVLAMPVDLLSRITLGIFPEGDEAQAEEQGLDVICELSNVVAGRVMRSLVGEDAGFEVGLPSTGAGRLGDVPGGLESHVFNAEENALVLFLEGDVSG